MIGWGAGRWDINCRAVQIALVGNYAKTEPTREALDQLQKLILYYRGLVPSIIVTSHKAVRPQPTDCPGAWWDEWRKTLK